VSVFVSPPAALALGVMLALAFRRPLFARARAFSKYLLQGCVVLLGFGMDLPTVLRAGASGMLFAAATISTTLLVGSALGRWLSIEKKISILISSGTAICGGSAIAAVGSVLDAEEGEMSVALGTVFILNGVALFLFPPLGHWLRLSQAQFGTWAGVAIHDISSVVGASSVFGLEALNRATAVKLSRALWIAPLSLAVAALFARRKADLSGRPRKLSFPWFIGLFLLASVARSFLPAISAAGPWLSLLARAGFAATLFLIGAGLSPSALSRVGWRPLLQGVLLWIFIAAGSLLSIIHFG
jgi:uncharacterized integral membrane protein (TIGR00698 family)